MSTPCSPGVISTAASRMNQLPQYTSQKKISQNGTFYTATQIFKSTTAPRIAPRIYDGRSRRSASPMRSVRAAPALPFGPITLKQ